MFRSGNHSITVHTLLQPHLHSLRPTGQLQYILVQTPYLVCADNKKITRRQQEPATVRYMTNKKMTSLRQRKSAQGLAPNCRRSTFSVQHPTSTSQHNAARGTGQSECFVYRAGIINSAYKYCSTYNSSIMPSSVLNSVVVSYILRYFPHRLTSS